MQKQYRCPICDDNASKECQKECTIYECNSCGRFNIDEFYKEPDLSEHDKLVLKHYFTKLTERDMRRLTIISEDNLKEII